MILAWFLFTILGFTVTLVLTLDYHFRHPKRK